MDTVLLSGTGVALQPWLAPAAGMRLRDQLNHSRVVFWVPLEVCCTVLSKPGANSSSWSSLVGRGFADDQGVQRQVRQRVPVHPRWPRAPGQTSVAGVLVPRPPPGLPVLLLRGGLAPTVPSSLPLSLFLGRRRTPRLGDAGKKYWLSVDIVAGVVLL